MLHFMVIVHAIVVRFLISSQGLPVRYVMCGSAPRLPTIIRSRSFFCSRVHHA